MDSKLMNNDSAMGNAYDVAGTAFRERLRVQDPEQERELALVRSAEIVAVRGCYDHVERVLQATRVPFSTVDPERLSGIDWEELQVLLVNCPGQLPDATLRRLAPWVRAGGYLVTTDWALKHVVQRLFPNTVRHNGQTTNDCVVRIEMDGATSDPLLAGFLEDGRDPLWWLEGSSYPIEVLDSARVRVLIRSREVGSQWGADPVVVTFEEGRGTVLHLLSHLYLQRSDVRGSRDAQPASVLLQEMPDLPAPAMAQCVARSANLNAATLKSAFTTTGLMAGAIIAQKRKQKGTKGAAR
jgi:hypothetical protein